MGRWKRSIRWDLCMRHNSKHVSNELAPSLENLTASVKNRWSDVHMGGSRIPRQGSGCMHWEWE